MRPGKGLTLVGLTYMTLAFLFLTPALIEGKPAKEEEKENDSEEEECPQFIFNECDYEQSLCENDDPGFTEYMDNGKIFWKSDMTKGKSGKRSGVLAIQVDECVTGINISFGLVHPEGWSFAITDMKEYDEVPAPGNGDLAELHSWQSELIIYQRDESGKAQDGGPVPLNLLTNYLPEKKKVKRRLDFQITKDSVVIDTYPKDHGSHLEFHDLPLFKFKDGIAIGLNRDAVENVNWAKMGSGVYAVCIKLQAERSEYDYFGFGGWG